MGVRKADEIHCHHCGGFMSGDPQTISYRLRLTAQRPAAPHAGLCACRQPVVYGPPPGYLSSPGMPLVDARGAGD